MSERDILASVIGQWIEAFNEHDAEGIVKLYAEGAELFDAGMKHPRQGRGEIEKWFQARFKGMPGIQYARTGDILGEDEGAVLWTARGRTPPLLGQKWLARTFEVDGVSIFRVRAGLICWQRGYYDHLAVVERVIPFLKWLPSRL